MKMVLIVAKCNVNFNFSFAVSMLIKVLIVAKCNVNKPQNVEEISYKVGINSSKV